MHENIERLKELNELLPMPPVVIAPGRLIIAAEVGRVLLSLADASIEHVVMTENTAMAERCAKEATWLIVFSDDARLLVSADGFDSIPRLPREDGYYVLGKGDWIYVPPSTAYHVKAESTLHVISISVPHTKDYQQWPGTDGTSIGNL